ncbi:MAG TPA: helix-turn-helix domain-containing protein [Candidatus Nanoarchaeia archaeon]|nr:helix-turn-helix domain-containing protein [Candidatus Nanoarchaeia archaeon]
MQDMIIYLQEYGLTNNESKVYLANLQIGKARANDIAKKAGLLRTTTYEVLTALSQKGLTSNVIISGVKYFEATEPKKLLDLLDEKREKILEITPTLENIKRTFRKNPEVQLYEGKEGLKTILGNIIKTQPKEILTISSSEILKTLEFYFPHWIRKRIQNKIYARVLQEKTPELEKMKLHDKKNLREIRFLPRDFTIKTYTQIYEEKVAILTLSQEDLFGMIINNKDLVETYQSHFENLWKQAK